MQGLFVLALLYGIDVGERVGVDVKPIEVGHVGWVSEYSHGSWQGARIEQLHGDGKHAASIGPVHKHPIHCFHIIADQSVIYDCWSYGTGRACHNTYAYYNESG